MDSYITPPSSPRKIPSVPPPLKRRGPLDSTEIMVKNAIRETDLDVYESGVVADMREGAPRCFLPLLVEKHAFGTTNRCVTCRYDMGPNNPRQLCGKTECEGYGYTR